MYQYIDIFDDDLYDPYKFSVDKKRYDDLLNTIRLQVLVSILFNRQIVVPEQWAVSSSSFLKIADEVIRGYEREVTFRESRSEISRKLIPPPFVISFLANGDSYNEYYARSIIRRIESGSRIRIAGSTSDQNNEEYSGARDKLKGLYAKEIGTEGKESRWGQRFVDGLYECIGDSETAIRISTLAKYLDSNRSACKEYGLQNYQRDLAKFAGNVKKVCFEDEIIRAHRDIRIEEFRSFFEKAERDNISLAEITRLWRMSETFSKPSYDLITKMGQYCLHRALSENTNAEYGSTFYGSFGSYGRDTFDETIIDRMRRFEFSDENVGSQNRDFQFIALENSEKYDLGDKIYWPEVWGKVGAFSVSDDWQNSLKNLKSRLNNMPLEKVHDSSSWNEIFDFINGKVVDFSFKQSKSNIESFTVAIKYAGDTQVLSKGASMAEPTLFGPIAMLASIAKASIKYVPFEYELKLTRSFRKAKQIFSSKK